MVLSILIVVVVSKSEWDSMQETLRIMRNEYLSNKVLSGLEEFKQGKAVERELLGVDDD